MTPSLQHFETFLAVAETGSFTAAAKKVGNSKSAVSQTIRLLESALRLPLFIRTTRSVKLTAEGELLFEQCKRLNCELVAARDIVNGFHTSPSGKLKISCSPYFSDSHLLGILEKYMKKFPKVTIEVLTEERMPNMQQEQVDIVFGVNWPAPEDVVARVIGKTKYVLCASPEYLNEFGTPKVIKDLENHRYIPHCKRTAGNTVASLKTNDPSLRFSPQLKLNNSHFMKKCALIGMGIIQVHDYVIAEELNEGLLVELLPEYLNETMPLYIYYQKHRFVQPKVREFVNLCDQIMSDY